MRDYIFYPFAVSRPMRKLSKAAGTRFGQAVARTLPAAAGNLLVFLLVGVWHGASLNYIAWGLYNGLVLAVSSLLEPVYKSWNDRHSALSSSKAFHIVRVIRTFIVVNIGWFFDRSSHPAQAMRMIASLFTQFDSAAITPAFFEAAKLAAADGVILACALMLVLLISLLREHGVDVRAKIAAGPYLPRLALMLAACVCIVIFGVWGAGFDAAAFIYNAF